MLYRLATIGAPRGLRGEVRLIVHTDDPRGRLAPGTQVHIGRGEDDAGGALVVSTLIEREGRWYATFEGYPDRTSVEGLVNEVLRAPGVPEEDAWYAEELRGLTARRPTGEEIGTVVGLEHYPAHDMLVVEEPTGEHTLVPLVDQIVTEIDIPARLVTIDAPRGLFVADGDVE